MYFQGSLEEHLLANPSEMHATLQHIRQNLADGVILKSALYIDIPIPASWRQAGSPASFSPGENAEEPTMLITYGERRGEVHIEEEATSQILQHVAGGKTWLFWSPDPKPKRNKKPDHYITTKPGQLLFVPGGWWQD